MNGDISRIPIQSLGGVLSLTDILPELPLPAPTQASLSSQSLLYDTRLSEEAHRWLNSQDDNLVQSLTMALGSTNTDNIEFKESSSSDTVDMNAIPPLLKAVVSRNQSVFQTKRGFNGMYNQSSTWLNSSAGGAPLPSNTPTIASGGVGRFPGPAPHQPWVTPVPSAANTFYQQQRLQVGYPGTSHGPRPVPISGFETISQIPPTDRDLNNIEHKMEEDDDGDGGSPKKRKKKKKKKKKHRDSKEVKDESMSSKGDDTAYSVNVVTDPNKISLKISLKRPTEEADADSSSANVRGIECPLSAGSKESSKEGKERKKKKKDKHRKSEERAATSTSVPNLPRNQIILGVEHEMLASPTSRLLDAENGLFGDIQALNAAYPGPNIEPVPNFNSSVPGMLANDFVSSPNVSQYFRTPVFNLDKPMSSSGPGLFDHWPEPGQDIMPVGTTNQQTTRSPLSIPSNFSSYPAGTPGLYPNPALMIPHAGKNDGLEILPGTGRMAVPANISARAPANQAYQNQNRYPPSSMQQTISPPVNIAHAKGKPDYFFDENGTTHNLNITKNARGGSILAAALTANNDEGHSTGRGKPEAYMDHMNDSYVPLIPLGLAGYMPNVDDSVDMGQMAAMREQKIPKTRRQPVNRRPKRRRNELDDLRTWHMKDPANEKTWDQTIGSYSQALGERVKRRKRQARQPGNSAFVFEDDEDYPSARMGGDDKSGDSGSDAGDSINGGVGGEGIGSSRVVGTRSSGNTAGHMRSYAGMDDEEELDRDDSGRRKKKDDDEPFEKKSLQLPEVSVAIKRLIKLKEPAENRYPHLKKSKEQVRRRERISLPFTCVGLNMSHLSADQVMESGSYKRFLHRLEKILEVVEEVDLKQLVGEADQDATVEIAIPVEAKLSTGQLSDLCKESAKLKAVKIMNQVPVGRLVKLLTILLLNVREGNRVVPTLRAEPTEEEEGGRLWRECAVDRVMRSVEAGLAALHIMTSSDMPKEVYVEDVIEKTITVTKFQLANCIYPEYDPAYRVDNSAKETQSSIRSRRARERDGGKPRAIIQLYNRLVETVGTLSELVEMQELTDNLVLQLSSMGVAAFFVENVSELQLNALKLVTTIFSRYEPHRKLIMEDILASLARLPSSKKNLRSYRLNSEDSIQMLTALALLLVQSVIQLPQTMTDKAQSTSMPINTDEGNKLSKTDDEVLVVSSYQHAMRTAHTFLLVFLRKSTTKGEDDYRIIFENFVNDLLLTVNKPEWPAAELLLSLLGSLLVQQFNNKQLDQATRVASVDYLGTVASTLRRDAVNSRMKEKDIEAVIRDLVGGGGRSEDEDEDAEESDEEERASKGRASKRGNKRKQPVTKVDPLANMDRCQALRDALLDYLAEEQVDPTVVYARKFYLAQWLNDCTKETERAQKQQENGKNKQDQSLPGGEETTVEDEETKEVHDEPAAESSTALDPDEVLRLADSRKKHLFIKITEGKSQWQKKKRNTMIGMANSANESKPADGEGEVAEFVGTMDYEDACLVCRYVASMRPFSQSFDIYLSQIRKLLNESSVAVRTKAMRCLSAVVEADPSVLAREDIKMSVHASFLDSSTSVREAAIELVGKYILTQPQLTSQYYVMLSGRILDKGISVRKRVIKIFRDICLEQPEFPKIPEICVKIIRRVNDEEGIKKLVNEVFQTMWFTPTKDKDNVKLLQKVMNITDVVAACKDTGFEWFEQFLQNLLKKEESEKAKPVEKACKQIVDCLVQNIMRLEEISTQSNHRLVSCLATLHLFTKIRPELMVQYTMTLQPYLNIKCNTQEDTLIIHYVTRMLEVTVPLMEHPSETYLAQLEEVMVQMTLRHGKLVLESCVSCLGAVVNKVSKNYALVKDCFHRFFNALTKCRKDLENDPDKKISPQMRPSILRALFTVGLLCKHFDFDAFEWNAKPSIRDEVFNTLMFFTESIEDHELRKKALSGLGFLCTRHHELLCGAKMKSFYQEQLSSDIVSHEMKCIVLENLLSYLLDEERRMVEADAMWKAKSKQESLKELGDVASGMGSAVAQFYLTPVLNSFLHSSEAVRMMALNVVVTILRQGLIHPVQTVAYLICLQTDVDSNVRLKADNQLHEIDKKFACFISMRAIQGLRFSYSLQQTIQSKGVVRGIRDQSVDIPLALNHHLYSMLRGNRQYRRSLLNALLNLFDESQRAPLGELIYIADNLAYFPYQCQEEPLFLVHHIDLMVSIAGSNILQSVRDALFPELRAAFHQLASLQQETAGAPLSLTRQIRIGCEEDETEEGLLARFMKLSDPSATGGSSPHQVVKEAIRASKACVLLLTLKQFFKDLYTITDSKIQKYSPSDSAKLWEKQLSRRGTIKFEPNHCLEVVTSDNKPSNQDETKEESTRRLIRAYLDFRNLIMTIDPSDGADSDGEGGVSQSLPGAGGEDALSANLRAHPAFEKCKELRIEVNKLDIRTLPTAVSVVPQVENSDSDMDNSDLSDCGGSNRLMLAQSAPVRRKSNLPGRRSSRPSSSGRGIHRSPKKQRRKRVTTSSSSDQESADSIDEESSDSM